MTDKPEIKVGQRWVTRGGRTVRIVATDCGGDHPIMGFLPETREADFYALDGTSESSMGHRDGFDLISLAPTTVKREVALFQWRNTADSLVEGAGGEPRACDLGAPEHPNLIRISEPVTIEFTLLPGESE